MQGLVQWIGMANIVVLITLGIVALALWAALHRYNYSPWKKEYDKEAEKSAAELKAENGLILSQ